MEHKLGTLDVVKNSDLAPANAPWFVVPHPLLPRFGIPNPSCPEWYLGEAHAEWLFMHIPCAHVKHA